MNNIVAADIKARLPMPQGMKDIEPGQWRVLCESIFPTARSSEAIVLAVDYCRARKLDILKKPVHIVPMWSSSLKREVETVWPSITEVQTTAARTGAYAGMDEPKLGPMIEGTFKGIKRDNVGETIVTLKFPEWCSVTVYRMVAGQRCAFTEPVYWMESYARIGKTELPNDQWAKRPLGMITKVAKAFSLRAAFPEETSYTAEEMEGRVIEETDGVGEMIDVTEPLKKAPAFKNSAARKTFVENVAKSFENAPDEEELKLLANLNKAKFDEMDASGNEHDALAVEELRKIYSVALHRIKEKNVSEAEYENVEEGTEKITDEEKLQTGI